jgi:N-acetylglucosaminyl-diphospho-decaprenol L-rhamnosyltransferase
VTVPGPDPPRGPAPRTTVVLVTWRSRDHLPGCLAALEAAKDEDALETIVVDNASDDDTVACVRERAPGALVVRNDTNRGFAAAVNEALRLARGDAVLLLNPDVVLGRGCIARLRRDLDEDETLGLAGPQLLFPDGRPQRSAWDAPRLPTLAFDAFLLYNLLPRSRRHPLAARIAAAAEDVDALSGACLLVRRSCFESLGGLDERFFLYFEDVDLGLRARAAGWRVRLVPDARAVHALGGSAFRDRRAFWRHYETSRRELFRKHLRGPRRLAAEGLQIVGLAMRAAAWGIAGLVTADARLRTEAGHVAATLLGLVRPTRR